MARIYSLLLLVSFIGCSSPKPTPTFESTGQFKISVKSGGEEMKDLDSQLLHRKDLSQAELKALRVAAGMVTGTDALDQKGKRYGIRLRSRDLSALGLQPEDVITAVGEKTSPTRGDLEQFFREIPKTGESRMTFDRRGTPHKIILSLSPNGKN